jgi:hypothetical protein
MRFRRGGSLQMHRRSTGVTLPEGYRQWELVAPALEDEPLNEFRAVVGNSTAINAYRAGTYKLGKPHKTLAGCPPGHDPGGRAGRVLPAAFQVRLPEEGGLDIMPASPVS